MTTREKIDTKIDFILEQNKINIAKTKKAKFKDEVFILIQEEYLKLNREIRKELYPQMYK